MSTNFLEGAEIVLRWNQYAVMNSVWNAPVSRGKVTLRKQKLVFCAFSSLFLASQSLGCKNRSVIKSTKFEIGLPGVESWLFYLSSVGLLYLTSVTSPIIQEQRKFFYFFPPLLFSLYSFILCSFSFSLPPSFPFFFQLASHKGSFLPSEESATCMVDFIHHFPLWRPKKSDTLSTPTSHPVG